MRSLGALVSVMSEIEQFAERLTVPYSGATKLIPSSKTSSLSRARRPKFTAPFLAQVTRACGSSTWSARCFHSGRGFEIEAQYSDWNREPITGTSREIITTARRTG